MAQNVTAAVATATAQDAPKLLLAETGTTEKLQVVICREGSDSDRQILFRFNGLFARTDRWKELKRFTYQADSDFGLVQDCFRNLVHELLGDADSGSNLAIKSIEFGADSVMPNIDEEYWHLLPYFARMVVDYLRATFDRELEIFIVTERFFSLSVESAHKGDRRAAEQDRLHLQVLKQTFPHATVVANFDELERLRLGAPTTSADAAPTA